MQRYNPKEIEGKWQQWWDEQGTYRADLTSSRPKYMAMSMFNYPSGAGIHIGHAMNYTISDVKARFKRQAGYESYHPVGWDAFGLPAENYAIKSGVSPQKSMAQIIPSYHKQYRAMGWSNDWSKEIATHEPEYYRWTQWIFLQMYQHGLAYQDSRLQWWCEQDNTVLSNEQVIDGKCWRHDGADDPLVKQREVKQWFFKITEYADELLDAIDDLDWTPSVKLAQQNWIGRSIGAEIDFAVDGAMFYSYIMGQKNITPQDIEAIGGEVVRTAASGHLCVRFPRQSAERFEQLIIDKMELGFWNEYIGDEVVFIFKHKDGRVERLVLNHGTHDAIRQLGNAFNGQPDDGSRVEDWLRGNAWYAEVLPAPAFSNPNKITVFTTRPDTIFGATFLVLAPEHDLVGKITSEEQRTAVNDYVDAAKRLSEIDRQAAKDKTGVFTGAYAVNPANGERVPVWIADYVLTGYGTGAIMAVPAHDERDFAFAQKFELPVVRVVKNAAADDECSADEGVMINSGEFDGQPSGEARENIVKTLAKAGKATEKVNYKMRDWSVSRQRYWGAPIPIIHCAKCGSLPVPDDQLPVVLPELADFQPSGDGRSALARAADWLKVDCPQCGGPAERETDTLDTYICSSWYMFRYLDPRSAEQIFNSDIVNKWAPVDFYNGGDHATAHLLYARFVTRFFTKIGIMDNPEPFKQMLFNGKIRASDGSAFSKSKGNGIDPLEIINSGYGADALRTYLMFAAPLEFDARWDPQGVPGTYRFLNRAWTLVQAYNDATGTEVSDVDAKAVRQVTHRMIHKVSLDLEENRYNTAIAAAMTAVNELFKLKVTSLAKHDVWQAALEALVCCIAPFAPHIAEELWHQLGHDDSVHVGHWPVFDEAMLSDETVTVVVQVNGKLRGDIQVAADADEATVVELAQNDEKVAAHLNGKAIKKTIYVPGKLVNFVVG